jgi:hypothetical protein
MKRALAIAFAACSAPEPLEPWQLDHDRVVAVRAEPPHLPPGEVALLDALVAHADGPTTVEPPRNAAAPGAPGGLFTAVHFNIDHWQIDGPDDAALTTARAELGLPDGAPVPLEVTIEVSGPLYAKKIVWLGDARANPAPPAFNYGPDVSRGEHTVAVEPPAGSSVRWLTSCGTLRADGEATASHVVDAPCEGELVVVVRDDAGGVVWQVLPVRAR